MKYITPNPASTSARTLVGPALPHQSLEAGVAAQGIPARFQAQFLNRGGSVQPWHSEDSLQQLDGGGHLADARVRLGRMRHQHRREPGLLRSGQQFHAAARVLDRLLLPTQTGMDDPEVGNAGAHRRTTRPESSLVTRKPRGLGYQ